MCPLSLLLSGVSLLRTELSRQPLSPGLGSPVREDLAPAFTAPSWEGSHLPKPCSPLPGSGLFQCPLIGLL